MNPTPSMTGKTPQTQEDIQSNDNENHVGDDDDDFGLEHFDNRFDLFGSMNEEWIIRLNRLEDQEEAARAEAAAANDESQQPYATPEHVSLTKTLLYTSRLANLECASWTYKQQQKDTYNLEELIRHVEDEIDHDGEHHANTIRAILEGMEDATIEAKNNPQHRQNAQSTKMVSEENSECDDVDIDAFFQEYPECDRWNYEQPRGDYCPSDSDSDDDSNDEEKENRKSKRQATTAKTSKSSTDPSPKDVTAMTIDLVEAASEPIPTQPQEETTAARAKQPMRASEPSRTKDQQPRQESQSQPRRDANPPISQASTAQNPYNKTHQHVVDQQPPPQPQQQRPPSRHGNRNNTPGASQNPYSKPQQSQMSQQQQRPPMVSNPYNKRPLSSENNDASNNNDNAWRNHQHQTNPFQTAREVAIAEQNYPHRDPYRQHQQQQGGGGYQNPRFPQQQQPYSQQHRHQQQQQQNPFQNPYGNDFQGHQQDYGENNPTNDANTTGGGPYIPESLKRKFQRPKRGLGSSVSQRSTRQPAPPSRPNPGGGQTTKRPSDAAKSSNDKDDEDELPEELQHLDKELVKKIQNEIQESGDTVTFDDIAGLDDAKATVQEVVCWPMKRPDLFTGLRRAPNGLLLYGPPGTGKTLIGKAIAHESGATFFSISSSSLTSKWIGEGEKLVKTLFAVAAYNEPAVIFLDEIDSLLTQRKATENEASRRIKTEFLVQLDGTGTSGQGRVLIIGATNRPQELDEAARRRFTKRLYIPLPIEADRRVLLEVLLKTNNHVLTKEDIDTLARDTKGFSGADLKSLCTDAAMGPIRQLGSKAMDININDVPPISYKHFKKSLRGTRPSVAPEDLTQYVEWDKTYGTKRYDEEEEDEDD